MRISLNKLPKEIQDLIYVACDIASKNNMPVYLVGGFVRDLFLGVKNLDLDIVVEGDGISFAEDFAKRLNAKFIQHRRFGTASVVINHHFKVDIATARCESYPEPASLPLVAPGTLKDDLARRDFTINAMAISISGDNFGRLIDLFNGRDDIRRKKIRVLHDLSFIDDPTRILRAIRFEQRYNFKIERHTLRLFKNALSLRALNKTGPHRLRDEIILILKEPHPIRYIKRIDKLIGFSFISPQFHFSKKTASFLRSIERQILWFKNKTPRKRTLDTWLIYLIGLINNMPTKHIKAFCKRFAFSKGEIKRILSYKKIIVRLKDRLKKKIPPSQIYKCLEPLSYEVILLLNAKYKDKILRKNIKDFFNIYNGIRIHTRGSDLVKLAISPGPDYKNILKETLYAKLDGKINTKEEELEFIKRLIKQRLKDKPV